MTNSFDHLPLVSVIVPTYNRCQTLKHTLGSILDQTFKNIEVFIVDDGSSDQTHEVVMNFQDTRIKYLRAENWGGPARPRNIGLKHATGEYVAFCDDDDIWHDTKIEFQLEMIKRLNVDAVYTNARIINKKLDYPEYYTMNSGIVKLKTFLTKSNLILSSSFLKKTIFDNHKFNESKKYIGSEDFILWIDLLCDNKVLYYSSHSKIDYLLDNQTSIRKAIDLGKMCFHHFFYVSSKIMQEQRNLFFIPIYAFIQLLRICKFYFKKPW